VITFNIPRLGGYSLEHLVGGRFLSPFVATFKSIYHGEHRAHTPALAGGARGDFLKGFLRVLSALCGEKAFKKQSLGDVGGTLEVSEKVAAIA